MKALSIRQPWAWLIVRPDLISETVRLGASIVGDIKDIENRTWHTNFRGRFLVHASKGMTWDDYRWAATFAREAGVDVPAFDDLRRGGIIGSVELVDCVNTSSSRWYMGDKGFVLRDPKPLRFTPWKGQLGFYDVPYTESELSLEHEKA